MSAVGKNVVPKVGLVTSVSSKLIKLGPLRFNAGLIIVSISRFVTCAVSEIIERVVLICPSTSSSYSGLLVLIPTLIFSCAFYPTNIASFSNAPVPTEISSDSSPWILNDLTLLNATSAPAVITL